MAIGLAIWQYDLVVNRVRPTTRAAAPAELQFKMNNGRLVSVSDDTSKFCVVVFWNSASDRSLALIPEVLEARRLPELDSVFNFYIVSLSDSPEVIRQLIDFDDLSLPFAYEPEGQFLENSPIRTLPLTVIFDSDGKVFSGIEGYGQGEFANKLRDVAVAKRLMGPSDEFRFRVE